MGRQKYNKRNHIEKSNILLENNYMKEKGLLTEQTPCPPLVTTPNNWWNDPNQGLLNWCYTFNSNPTAPFFQNTTNTTGAQLFIDCGCSLSGGTTTCDLSCVDDLDPFTDSIIQQGGGPNNLQPYDASATYAPGSVVCHLDPTLGVTNIYVASANSGNLVPGGGQYPPPNQWVTAWPWPLPPGASANDYYWEPGLIIPACGGNGTWTGGAGDWWCDPTGAYVSPTGTPCVQSPTQPQSYFTGPSTTEQDCITSCGTGTEFCCRGGVTGQYQCMQVTQGDCGTVLGDSGPYPDMPTCQTQSPNCGGMPTPGCPDPQCTNFDPNAVGCPDPAGNPDPNDTSCCTGCGGLPVAGCLDPSSPNYDPSATTDCSGNPQPAAGYGDTSCCGGANTGGCMELWVTKCAGSSPGFQIGQSNLHFPCPHVDGAFALPSLVGQEVGIDPTTGYGGDDVYTVDQVNPNPNYPANWTPNSYLTTNVSCGSNQSTASCDFSWASTCAQSELNTGGQNSWQNFLDLRETGFNGVGCQHLQNVVNWTTDQLNSGVTGAGAPLNPTQIARKTEQIEWAQCQASECGCSTLNVPPLTGGPTPPPPSAPPVKDKPKKGEKGDLNEQFTRMKELWKYNKL